MIHQPVLVNEVVAWLQPRSSGVYVDGTVGSGGHAEALLTHSTPSGRLVGCDRDEAAVARARARLTPFSDRVEIFQESFGRMDLWLGARGISRVDGVVLDLGWSSEQIEDASRGFSVHEEGPLDMRLDRRDRVTAADIVNTHSEEALTLLFREAADEPFADRIAKAIVRARADRPFDTTGQLSAVVARATPARARHGRRHVATRVFQALRVAVNRERETLAHGLGAVSRALKPGGRVVVISFHSGEDRMVKQTFRAWADQGTALVLTKKPVKSSRAECAANPRARSACLRVAERLEDSKQMERSEHGAAHHTHQAGGQSSPLDEREAA